MAPIREKRVAEFVEQFRVAPGAKVELARDFDPSQTQGVESKKEGKELLANGIGMLAEYQSRLYAEGTHGVLIVLQALDAAGKDGTIRHVMSGVNPQGVAVHSFKVPSSEELDHDYLWRYAKNLPGPRADRDLQPLALRRGARRPCPRGAARAAEAAEGGARPRDLEAPLPRDQRLGAVPHRQRDPRGEAVPQPVEGGAAGAVPAPDRPARPQLEVLVGRRAGARLLGRLPGCILGDALAHEHRVGPLACDPGRPQVVRADRRRRP